MQSTMGWKVATVVLALTTVTLAVALVLEPEPDVHVVFATPPVGAPESPARADRGRRRVSPPPAPHESAPRPPAPGTSALATSTQGDGARAPRARQRLAELSVDGVCRQELLVGGTAPAEAVVERLLLDRDRATELMLDWFAKRNDPRWRALGLQLAPHFNATFLAVAGNVAATPMRKEWLGARDTALMAALVRHGDAETLRTIDEEHRKPHPQRRENPYLLVELGEPARAMVWGWINDPSVEKSVRTTAIAGMWVRGTDEDRRRLWTEMDDTIRVLHFAPHMARDENDWSRQLRGRVEAMLADSDPWVRVHGARAALQNRFEWGDEFARRAFAIAAEYADLPVPEGRDAFDWKETLRWIGIHRASLEKAPGEPEIRDALGLE